MPKSGRWGAWMRATGWKRLGIVLLGAWWLFWMAAFLIARSERDHALRVIEAADQSGFSIAASNPVVIGFEVQMNQALLAIFLPVAIGGLIFVVRWVAAGFRKQD